MLWIRSGAATPQNEPAGGSWMLSVVPSANVMYA